MSGDNAGNTFELAREIWVGAGLQAFSDRVDSLDPNDYYRFTVTSHSSLNATLNGLSGDATLQLLNSSGGLVDFSDNSGTTAEAINTLLAPGTYYIRVSPNNPTGSDYTLGFNLQAGAGNLSLFWRDAASGSDGFWRMGGANHATIAAIDGLPTVDSTWQVRAIADFNRDGIADLLWRDTATGTNGIWLMGGANNAAIASVISLPSASTNWQIGGVADFNGDGTLDIVWRDTATGNNGVWLMGGANNAAMLSVVSLTAASTNWQIGAVADFNGDGHPDLIWRDAATGANGVWLMGGSTNTTITSVVSLTSTSSNWQIQGIADFNTDGNADIVWRDTATGTNGVWLMGGANNATISAIASLPSAPLNWQSLALTQYSSPPPLDLAGNDFSTAFNVGTLAGNATFRDRIGGGDANDFYRMTVSQPNSLSLTLNGLSADADVQLYDNIGILLQTSARNGTASEAIATSLSPGTYYVRVYSSNVDTRYALNLATVPISPPTVSIAASDPTAAETTSGQTPNPGQFTITRTGSTATALTVNYTLSGSATNGSDYNSLGNSIVIPVGQSSITVPINVIDDTLVEGTETVVFTLASNSAYTLGSSTTGTVSIADNDVAVPTVTITTSDPNAAETTSGQTPNPGQFTITRSGSTTTALTVNYTISGTATNGTDYSQVSNSIVIPVGQSSITVPIAVINDTLVEGTETVVFTLATNNAYTLGNSATGTVSIADNDVAPTVTIAATDANAAETTSGQTPNPGQFTITRTGNTTTALTVNYTISGTATNGTDYSQVSNSIVIPVGQSSITVPINVIDDTLVDINETVVLSLASNSAYTLGTSTTGTVTIADNDTVNAKLLASDGTSNDNFGSSIAIDGNTIIAGARWDDNQNGVDAGAAYIYKFNGTSWVEQAKLTASDGAAGDLFGEAVRISGNTAIVGAGKKNSGRGAAYIYQFNGTNWVQQAELTANDGAAQDDFGFSVAISGNRVVVGAEGKNNFQGAAYTYQFNGTSWVQQAKLTANNLTNQSAQFGYSVAIKDDLIGLGAIGDEAVYTYQYNGGSWVQQAKLTADDLNSRRFGDSVAIDDRKDRLIIGADASTTDAGPTSGAAYIFQSNGTNWAKQAKLTASDGVSGDIFAGSVGISGDTAIVSAYQGFRSPKGNGAAYLYKFNGTSWVETKLAASDGQSGDYFGVQVALSGSTVIAAATRDTIGTNVEQGSVYVFSNPPPTPTVSITASDANAAETTSGQTPNPGQFTITRTGNTSTALTVNYTISGSATNSSDYNSLGNSIVIPVGQSSITVPINVIDDTLVEGTETVVFTLATNSAYTLGNSATGTVSIADNEATLPDPLVRAKPATGINDLDALLPSTHTFWDTSANGGVIPYSFYTATSGAYYSSEQVSEVSNAVKTNVREILASLESLINVHFVEVADTSSHYGVLRYMFSNISGYAYGYYPSTNPLGGDVHLSPNYESTGNNGAFSAGKGSYGYATLIHETLHALGLKHPGNYNAGGGGTEGPYLTPSIDNETNTVMSYNNSSSGAGAAAIAPMTYDIRALQYLYGATNTNATATTYAFSSVDGYTVNGQFFGGTQKIKQSLWDSGGIDTLDFSGLAAGTAYRFDLNQGGLLTTQQAYNSGTYVDEATGGSYSTTTFGTAIAFNTVIENLINSRGNDTIIANSANNVFKGYSSTLTTGNDAIVGSNAFDLLDLANYRLTDLTSTVSSNDLTIQLGANGSVLAKNYFGSGNSMKVLVSGTYYTYSASSGWQVSTAPAPAPASPAFDFPTNVPSLPVTIENLQPVA